MTASPETVALACSSALLGYAIWEASAAEKTKPSTATKIRAGFAAVQSVCANPPTNNTEAILAAIAAVRAWQAEIERVRA